MVHTKDGSRVVREFLAQGTAKVRHTFLFRSRVPNHFPQDRKQIIKVIKPYIETMAKDEEAQLVLFTALDVIEYALIISS